METLTFVLACTLIAVTPLPGWLKLAGGIAAIAYTANMIYQDQKHKQ